MTSTKLRKPEDCVSHVRLLEVLAYDPVTGNFTWKVRTSNRVSVGDIAGCRGPDGYVRIHVDGMFYLAQRLAIFYVTGQWPLRDADHRSAEPGNDSFSNLRSATRAQNIANWAGKSRNRFGRGVRYFANPGRRKRYAAFMTVDGKKKNLGYFMTQGEAADAYRSAHLAHYGEYSAFARSP